MRRWASLAAVALLFSGLIPASARANLYLQVDLTLTDLSGQTVSSVEIGDHVVLNVGLGVGSGGSVSDLYGSSVDLYYDPTLVEPVLAGAGVTAATTSTGVITAGVGPDLIFTAVTSTGSVASPARISLISLRLGSATPGATSTGSLGAVEFVAKRSGSVTFTAQQSSANTNYAGGETVVTLLDSQGSKVSYSGSSISLTISTSDPAITHPMEMSYLSQGSLTVSGTGPASTSMNYRLNLESTQVASGPVPTDTSGGFSLSLSGLSDGTYTITIENASGSATRTFVVDTTRPSVAIDPPSALTDPYNVTGTCSDANIEAVYLTVNVSDTPLDSDRATLGGPGTWSKAVHLGSSGVLYATAVDRAGNVTVTSQTYSFTEPSVELKFAGADGSVPKLLSGDRVAVEAHLYNTPGYLRGLMMEMQVATAHFTLESTESVTTTGSFWNGGVTPIVLYSEATGRLTVTLDSTVPPASGNSLAFTFYLLVNPITTPVSSVTATLFAPDQTARGVVLHTETSGETIPAATPTSTVLADLIVGANLSGRVQLLGRTDWSGAVVAVIDSADNLISQDTTDAQGLFSLRVPQGSGYSLVIDRHSYLSRIYTGFSIGTTDVSGLMEELMPGDIVALAGTGTPRIFLEDLAALARNWGSPGTAADLNGSGSVDLADVSLLGQYWGEISEVIIYGQ